MLGPCTYVCYDELIHECDRHSVQQVNAVITCRRPKRVHGSFCSKMSSVTMLEVSDALRAADCQHTTQHNNRTVTSENWFDVWSEKAQEADYLLVFFVPEYKTNFSDALYRESEEIRKLHRDGTPVYVFEPQVR